MTAPGEPIGWRVAGAVATSDVDLAVDVVWQHAGVQAVEERAPTPSAAVELVVGVAGEGSARALLAALDARWPGAFGVEAVTTDEWLDAWREHARPLRAGRFELVPAWLVDEQRAPAASDDDGDDVVRLLLDPGRAFGSGSHESTRLALGALGRLDLAGRTVLDVGCGSGVLSVAAARLGAQRVLAVDVDPAALVATRENAQRNGVDALVEVDDGGLEAIREPVDVVAANILASVLVELAPAVLARLAGGGVVVLAGFVGEQVERVAAAYAPAVVVGADREGDWHVLVLRAPEGRDR